MIEARANGVNGPCQRVMIIGVNRAVVCLLVVAAPRLAASAPKPMRLSMKHTEGTNLHIADHRGAIHWSADIRIMVDLQADKKLEAVSTGTRGEHNLYAGGSGPSYNSGCSARRRVSRRSAAT